MSYEVRTYKTQSDYDNYNGVTAIDGITSKHDALQEGRLWLTDHEVVKVQSDDREFIELLHATR